MLAGLFKAPTKFAPHVNLPAARARANVVLDNLVEAGFMTEGQVFGARRHPATPVDRRDERGRELLSRLGVRRDAADWSRRCRSSTAERVFVVRTALDTTLSRGMPRPRSSRSLRQYGRAVQRRARPAAIVMETERRGARHGRRARLRRQPVQPRGRRAAPARLVVQDLMSTPRRFASRAIHTRHASWSTRRSASATGARRIMAAAIAGSMTADFTR